MNKTISIVLLSFIFLIGCSRVIPKLGISRNKLMSCPETPNCVSSQATDKKHFIKPIHFIGTDQDAQDRLLKILESWQRAKITVVQKNYIRAEFSSKIFRFVDDVEFYFPSTKIEKTIIYFRSASRIGYSDLGANRARIEQIRHQLK